MSRGDPGEEDGRPTSGPLVAIVTVTYNSGSVLPEFLASLSNQTFRDWMLVVIDNASVDQSRGLLESWADNRLHLICNDSNRGFAAASNQGFAHATQSSTPWVLVLNNDTAFQPNFLERLMLRAARGDAQVIAPRVTYYDDMSRNWYAGGHFSAAWGFRATLEGEGEVDDPSSPPERWVSFAPGCCKLIRTDLIRAQGAFDEAYFVYWEDTDLCWRWKQAGTRILYVREPAIRHKVSALTGGPQSAFTILMYHRNQMLFLRKHFGRLGAALLISPVLVKIGIRWLLRRDRFVEVGHRLSALRQGWMAPLASSTAAGRLHA